MGDWHRELSEGLARAVEASDCAEAARLLDAGASFGLDAYFAFKGQAEAGNEKMVKTAAARPAGAQAAARAFTGFCEKAAGGERAMALLCPHIPVQTFLSGRKLRMIARGGEDPWMQAQLALGAACSEGDAEGARKALAQGAQANAFGASCLKLAAANGKKELCALLLPLTDMEMDNGAALALAARGGWAECVELLSECAGEEELRMALKSACESDMADCARILAGKLKLSPANPEALHLALYSNSAQCARLLLPMEDGPALERLVDRMVYEKEQAQSLLLALREQRDLGQSARQALGRKSQGKGI